MAADSKNAEKILHRKYMTQTSPESVSETALVAGKANALGSLQKYRTALMGNRCRYDLETAIYSL